MRLILILVTAAVAACGPAGERTDAGVGVGSDGGTPPGATTLTCKAQTTTFVASDGSRTESRRYFAEVNGVDPSDDFRVEQCNYVYQSTPCTAPMCTVTGDAYPPDSAICQSTRSAGAFANGKLYIHCGSATANYNAAGALTGMSEARYMTVRIYK